MSIPQSLVPFLEPGYYYVTFVEGGLPVFGEFVALDDEEDARILEEHPQFRFVKAYSTACPWGEMGTVSIGKIFPLSRFDFEKAKACDWNVPTDVARQWAIVRINNLRAVTDVVD